MQRHTFPCPLHSHTQMDYRLTGNTASHSATCTRYSQKDAMKTIRENSQRRMSIALVCRIHSIIYNDS